MEPVPGESKKKKGDAKNKLQDSLRAVQDYDTWDPHQLAGYLKTVGLGDYYELVIQHKLTGKLAPLVTDQDLKDMGVNVVGDRIRFRQVIQSFSRKARMHERTKVIWEGEERLYWGCFDQCIGTCCGCCPDDPSTFKLTRNHLKVKVVQPARCGPMTLCCCYSYKTNNIDLTHVTDVDVHGSPPPCTQQVCCCAKSRDFIYVTYDETSLAMILKGGEGEHVSALVLNQIEEAQVMERD